MSEQDKNELNKNEESHKKILIRKKSTPTQAAATTKSAAPMNIQTTVVNDDEIFGAASKPQKMSTPTVSFTETAPVSSMPFDEDEGPTTSAQPAVAEDEDDFFAKLANS